MASNGTGRGMLGLRFSTVILLSMGAISDQELTLYIAAFLTKITICSSFQEKRYRW